MPLTPPSSRMVIERGRSVRCITDVDTQAVERPREKVQVCIDEARHDGASAEIDALSRDLGGIALPGLNAARDTATIIDGQAPHLRQGRIGRIDGAAFDNHGWQRSARRVAFCHDDSSRRD